RMAARGSGAAAVCDGGAGGARPTDRRGGAVTPVRPSVSCAPRSPARLCLQLDTPFGAHRIRRLIFGAAACLTLAACADSPPDPPAGLSLAKAPTTAPSACPAGTTGAEGALPGSGALYLICVPAGFDASTG